MNAKEGYIVRLLDGADKKFIIPVYQRAYSWKKANCELLFNDLLAVYNHGYKSHFFGSIVYVENDIGGCNEYIIIDGQQRITTVSLLLLAIRNYIQINKIDTEKINPEKITNAFLTDVYAQDTKKLKLKLVQGDDSAYDRLIEGTEPIPNNHITINYNYFYERLSTLNLSQLEGVYDAITKLMIVNISLKPQNGDDPQLIFESLNSTGMDLEESDKIRNYVLMKMDSSEQEKIYKKYWEKLEHKIGKQDLSKFIRYYLAKKTRTLTDEKKLYFSFKAFRENSSEYSVETLLKDILKFADYYSMIKTAKTTNSGFVGCIARMNKLELNMAIPLLFDFFDAKSEGKLTDEEITEAIIIIENYIVRRIICGMPTSSLNKVFVYMGEEINKYVDADGITYLEALKYCILSKTGKTRFPNDHDLEEKFIMFELYNAKPSVRKYIFERLENSRSKERVAVEEQISTGELTIEHIMPQTLTDEWKKYLGENYEAIHTKYIDTIGNLTLTAYNSDYSNLMFEKKRDMAEKGFSASKLELNSYLGECDEWNENSIVERANHLLQWAIKIWYAPTCSYEPNVIEKWISLDEEYDFTNKGIVKMSLLGDEINVDNVTDAYKKALSTLYMLDPVRFINSDVSFITTSNEKLRSPYAIGDSVYIETNMNSQTKITAIREIFDVYEIDNNEMAFLVRPKTKAFSISDQSTYLSITAGNLAFHLISDLIEKDLISDEEFELMQTKEYSHRFARVTYPMIALSRDAHRGKGTKYRYYKEPIKYKGREVYISWEWFDESINDLIQWYKEHF